MKRLRHTAANKVYLVSLRLSPRFTQMLAIARTSDIPKRSAEIARSVRSFRRTQLMRKPRCTSVSQISLRETSHKPICY